MKTKLKRFGVAIPEDLLSKFDDFIKRNRYTNRSEAIRDLIRAELAKENWMLNKKCAGIISIVYNHHKRELVDKIVDIQHDFQDIIVASQHIHLDHDNCLEVIITHGNSIKIQELANHLKATKGVIHSTLSFSSIV